jgi:hypothetical protein
MSTHETTVIKQVQIKASAKGWRLFRNSTGMAWQGRVTEDRPVLDSKGRNIGRVELVDARRVKYGLAVGSSDLIGWTPREYIDPETGERVTVAVFTAVECKTKGYGRTTEEQDTFLTAVAGSGGLAYLARPGKGDDVDLIPIEGEK